METQQVQVNRVQKPIFAEELITGRIEELGQGPTAREVSRKQERMQQALELIRMGVITPRMAGNTNILKLR